MSNLKNGHYNDLLNNGSIDSFVIEKEQFDSFFDGKYDGNIPDYVYGDLLDSVDKFKDSILIPIFINDGHSIDCKTLNKDLKDKLVKFLNEQRNFICGTKYNATSTNSLHLQLMAIKCAIDAVNYIFFQTIVLFIFDRDDSSVVHVPINRKRIRTLKSICLYPCHKFRSLKVVKNAKQLHYLKKLSAFIDEYIQTSIPSNINFYRKQWLDKNKLPEIHVSIVSKNTNLKNNNQSKNSILSSTLKAMANFPKAKMQELSIKFAYYLHQIVEDDAKYDIIKMLNEENSKAYMDYDEKFEKYAADRSMRKNFIAESSSPSITDTQIEKCFEIAEEFFEENEFDPDKKDLLYIVKAFAYELFIANAFIRDKNGSKVFAKSILGKKDENGERISAKESLGYKSNLQLNKKIFLYLVLDRALFRQKRHLNIYMKFYDVLKKLWKITEASYLTLEPEKTLDILYQTLYIFLQFFDDIF